MIFQWLRYIGGVRTSTIQPGELTPPRKKPNRAMREVRSTSPIQEGAGLGRGAPPEHFQPAISGTREGHHLAEDRRHEQVQGEGLPDGFPTLDEHTMKMVANMSEKEFPTLCLKFSPSTFDSIVAKRIEADRRRINGPEEQGAAQQRVAAANRKAGDRAGIGARPMCGRGEGRVGMRSPERPGRKCWGDGGRLGLQGGAVVWDSLDPEGSENHKEKQHW